MKIVTNYILNLILILLNPIFSLLLSTINMFLNKTKTNILLYALNLSFILIYFPLMPDMRKNLRLVFRLNNGLDFYNFIIKMFKNLNIPVMICIGIFYMIIIYSWLEIGFKIIENYKKNKLFYLIIILFTFTYRDISDLNRFLLANILFLNEFCYDYQKIKKILILIISILIHKAVILLWIIYFISYFYSDKLYEIYKENKFKIKILITLLVVFTDRIIYLSLLILSFFNKNLEAAANYYVMSKDFGKIFILDGTFGLKSYRIINLIVVIVFYYINTRSYKLNKNRFEYILYRVLFVLLIIFINYRTFSERYSLIFILISIILFLKNIKSRNKIIFISVLTLLKWILFSYPYSGIWKEMTFKENERFYNVIGLSGIQLLNIEKNGYGNGNLNLELNKKAW